MDRFATRYRYILAVLITAAVVTGGCRSAMFTANYLLHGNNVDAEFEGLHEKKVAVVCRPAVGLTYSNSHVAKDLAKQISGLLSTNDPKIEVVKQQDVDEWTDMNMWDEYSEVGKALEVDLIVGVDLQNFTIYKGPTVYQGKADVVVRVYDCSKPDRPVFEKILPQVVYPPIGGQAAQEKPAREFRQKFVRILADHVARHFYPHDAHADIGLDGSAFD